jgi:putative phosphoribosyl transferase
MFKDRTEAANALAKQLERYRHDHPLILGIARGAVPMAAQIAGLLDTDWDVLLAKKLSAPDNPEFAVAAVDESGRLYRSDLVRRLGIEEAWLDEEKNRQMTLMRERRSQYDAIAARIDPAWRTVIVVDDGLATGATMMAALHGLKQQGARQIICAVPIGSRQSVETARTIADEVICLHSPDEFYAVSQGYQEFGQVDDSVVLDLLRKKRG